VDTAVNRPRTKFIGEHILEANPDMAAKQATQHTTAPHHARMHAIGQVHCRACSRQRRAGLPAAASPNTTLALNVNVDAN